jgi:hypothetical protein
MRDGVLVVIDTKQSNKQVAQELESAHRTRLAKGEANLAGDAPTFKAYSARFLDSIRARSPKTASFYELKFVSILNFEPLASARLNRIDEALIDRYVQARVKKVAPATVTRSLASLRRALRQAHEWKLIARVPKIKMLIPS